MSRATRNRTQADLFAAVNASDEKAVSSALEQKINVNKELNGVTPLHVAIECNSENICLLLLKHGADPNAVGRFGLTPLYRALRNSNLTIIKHLIDYGSLLTEEDMLYAVVNSDEETIEVLLKSGAHISLIKSSLIIAAKCRSVDIVSLLQKYNADLNVADDKLRTPLHYAIDYQKHDLAAFLFKHRVNVNAQDETGVTPLLMAARQGQAKNVKALVKLGACVNLTDRTKFSPLAAAADKGFTSIVLTLLRNGANVNLADNKGETPLFYAARNAKNEVISDLLRWGADVNKTSFNKTALSVVGRMATMEGMVPLCGISRITKEDSKQSFQTIVDHVAIMQQNNMELSETVLKVVSNKLNRCHYEKCRREIQRMMNDKINSTDVTFYDILNKNTHTLASYLFNADIYNALSDKQLSKRYAIYGRHIRRRYLQAHKRQKFVIRTNRMLGSLFPQVPDTCKDKIVSFLNDDDIVFQDC